MKRTLIALLLSLSLMAGPAAAGTLWYNGDFDGSGDSLSNHYEYDDLSGSAYFLSKSYVYDDFVVPAGGWTVNSLWSNNLFSSGVVVSAAYWEIRSGVSAGNGGSVVQSGSAIPTVTPTSRTSGSYTEFQVLVSGLDFHLDPGTYWLNVTPAINVYSYYSYNSATSGADAVGQPPGDNGNSYYYLFEHFGDGGEALYYNFDPRTTDFSMGIAGEGSPVPLPASLPLLGSGLVVLLAARRLRKI